MKDFSSVPDDVVIILLHDDGNSRLATGDNDGDIGTKPSSTWLKPRRKLSEPFVELLDQEVEEKIS